MKSLSILGRLLAAGGLAAALSLAALPAAAYDKVVVFGDSLSDSGNNAWTLGSDPFQVITGNSYIPSQPYGSGTYSNGNVWASSFAAGLGLAAQASLTGGTNYAYGGATTRGAAIYPPSLTQQVNYYLGGSTTDIASTLFVIEGGGNNARFALESIANGDPLLLTIGLTARRYANDVGAMVDSLQAAGAQRIVVWNTPDLGLAPAVLAEGDAAAALGSLVATSMNNALAERLTGEAGVSTFDLFGLLGSVAADPGAYGLANVSDACGAVLGCDASSYLFWDGIHPTSAGHAILSSTMLAAVVPEPGTVWLFVAGIAAVTLRRRRAAGVPE